MTIPLDWALAWLAAVSLAAAFVTAWDKSRARRGAWRVPERTLWLIAALGGVAAMWLTMLAVRHKTRHPSFMWGLPLLTAAQTAAIYALWYTQIFKIV